MKRLFVMVTVLVTLVVLPVPVLAADLSVAGKQLGIHDGERSNLFFEAIRIIKEMRHATADEYPRFAVWENVPGVLSSNKGEDFRCVLEETARIVQEDAVIPRPGGANGAIADASWQTDGASLGEYTMRSFGEKPSMLTDECCFPALPNGVKDSLLSQILVEEAHQKYSLSAKACRGILNRANNRGKKLPEVLEQALKNQMESHTYD